MALETMGSSLLNLTTKQTPKILNFSNVMNLSGQVAVFAGSHLAENLDPDGNTLNQSNLTELESSQKTTLDKASCIAFEFYLYTVAMGILGLFGLVGNSMSFLVLRKDRGTPVATFLLQVLAVADNCFLLLWIITYSVKNYLRFLSPESATQQSYIYARVYTFPLLYMAQTETIWLTVVIALNRYMAVCMPYKAPHLCTIMNVYKEVIAVTMFSICINIPRFFEIEVIQKVENGSVITDFQRTELGKNDVYATVYTDALYYLFSFVLPLLILAFVNTRVTVAYQAAKKRKRRMTSRRSDNDNNITLVMIMIVLIFILCQAPARIVQLVWSYKYNHCREYQYYLIHISNTLEVLNSSVNFLIYFMFRKRFRDIIIEHFCCGPVVFSHRRDSAKATTTEGLSLAQFEQTNTAARCNSIKERNEIVCNHTPLRQGHEVNKVEMDVHEDDREPLNGIYKPPEEGVQEDIAEQQDDANVPLTV